MRQSTESSMPSLWTKLDQGQSGLFSQLQIDLVDMRNQLIEYENKVYLYILSIIDAFSRFHWLIPLLRKFPGHIKPHLEKRFIEHGPPNRLQSDRGKEFKKEVKEVTWN